MCFDSVSDHETIHNTYVRHTRKLEVRSILTFQAVKVTLMLLVFVFR